MKVFWFLLSWFPFLGYAMAAMPQGGAALSENLVNPGYQEHPDWFKASFLDIREDVTDAAVEDKRLILYFYQDGCPYCAKLLRENFAGRATVELVRERFDLIAINLWGDRAWRRGVSCSI